MPDYELYTLPNGLRIIYKHAPNTLSTHLGYTINVGSRHDGDVAGTAHCFEHMLFKGTQTRKAISILNHLENVGGEMNAFTTKEITVVYASVVNEFARMALLLLSDITFNSIFPENELEKEKKVIAEEINMYLDTPEENIFDEFQEQIFKGNGLAPNILGTSESLNQINTNLLKKFYKRFYTPQNMVLSINSNLPLAKFISWLEKFNFPKYELTAFKEDSFEPFSGYKKFDISKPTDHVQCHAIMGNIAFPHLSEWRYPMLLLNNVLGGPGMNSKLNLSVREKYGYTYSIESGYTAFADTGLFHIYFSTDKKYLNKCIDIVNKELKKMKQYKWNEIALKKVKNQFKGQIILGEESRINLMLLYGKNLVQGYPILQLNDVIHKIDSITADELTEVSQIIFDMDKLSYLAYTS